MITLNSKHGDGDNAQAHPALGKQKLEETRSSLSEKKLLPIEPILSQILNQSRQQFTGRLEIQTPQDQQWLFYFGMGRLIWASTRQHQRRRWRRQLAQCSDRLAQHSATWEAKLVSLQNHECWDYHLLMRLHQRGLLTSEQVKTLIAQTIAEVLFDFFRQGFALNPQCNEYPPNLPGRQGFFAQWNRGLRPSQQMLIPPSWVNPTENFLVAAERAWQQWRQAGLALYSPNLAPQLRQPQQLASQLPPPLYKKLVTLADGSRTLRELAAKMQVEVLKVARALLPFVEQKLIALEEVPDLNLPVAKTSNVAPTGANHQQGNSPSPLVVYFDDSPHSRQVMEQILVPHGYRYIGIGNPVEALPLLLEKKPDIIFLDLIMPAISGYEICAQIRQMSSFKNTPIAIVTGNDGIIDWVRAKVVGANEFIAKPIQAAKVLAVMQKFCQA